MKGKSFKNYTDIMKDKEYKLILDILNNAEGRGLNYLRPAHLLYILSPNANNFKHTSRDRNIGISMDKLDKIKNADAVSIPVTQRKLTHIIKILHEMRLIEIYKWTTKKPNYEILNFEFVFRKWRPIHKIKKSEYSSKNFGIPDNPNLWFADIRHRDNWLSLSTTAKYILSGMKKEDSDKISNKITKRITNNFKSLMIGEYGDLNIPSVFKFKNGQFIVIIKNEEQRKKLWKNAQKITNYVDKICSKLGKDDCIFIIEKRNILKKINHTHRHP